MSNYIYVNVMFLCFRPASREVALESWLALFDALDCSHSDLGSSLSLSGTTAPRVAGDARPMSGPISARATGSQQRARLHEIQRKRSELDRKRQAVRNYNEVDDP